MVLTLSTATDGFDGAGLTALRLPIGATDFSAKREPFYPALFVRL